MGEAGALQACSRRCGSWMDEARQVGVKTVPAPGLREDWNRSVGQGFLYWSDIHN